MSERDARVSLCVSMVKLRTVPGDSQVAVGDSSLDGTPLAGFLRDLDTDGSPCSRRSARLVRWRGCWVVRHRSSA